MRIGIDAGASSIEFAQAYGAAGVPVSSRALKENSVHSVLKPIKDTGLEVCQINAMGYNPLHPDDNVRLSSCETVLNAFEVSGDVGCPWVSINAGNHHPTGFLDGDKRNFGDAALESIAREIEPLLRAAEKADAYLSLEPYIKGAVFSSDRFLSLRRILGDGAKRLRINLDVTSFYDLHALINPDPLCDKLCDDLKDYIGLIHVKEIRLSESFHIHADLAPITEGPTDWERVLRRLIHSPAVDSWLIIEHVQSGEEAQRSIGHISNICGRLGL